MNRDPNPDPHAPPSDNSDAHFVHPLDMEVNPQTSDTLFLEEKNYDQPDRETR